MKKNILHKAISLWTVVLLLLPIGVQFFHTLENHEHTVCDSKEVSHIHAQEIDCSFCHVQLDTNTVFDSNCIAFYSPVINNSIPVSFEKQNTEIHLFYKSSRGPPKFIV